eukprot:249963-Amphidinium_carterae.1
MNSIEPVKVLLLGNEDETPKPYQEKIGAGCQGSVGLTGLFSPIKERFLIPRKENFGADEGYTTSEHLVMSRFLSPIKIHGAEEGSTTSGLQRDI